MAHSPIPATSYDDIRVKHAVPSSLVVYSSPSRATSQTFSDENRHLQNILPRINRETCILKPLGSRGISEPNMKYKHPKYRTKPCLNYMKGECPFGDNCDFVHLDRIELTSSGRPSTYIANQGQAWDWTPPLFIPKSTYMGDISSSSDRYRKFAPRHIHNGDDDDLISPLSLDSVSSPSPPPTRPVKTPPPTQQRVRVVHVPVYLPAPPVIPMFEQAKFDKMVARNRSLSVGSVTPKFYKTRPCKYFSQGGVCPRGQLCTFIHELNLPPRQTPSPSSEHSLHTKQENESPNGDQPAWRVLGGGVRIGDATSEEKQPCLDFLLGECSAGSDESPPEQSKTEKEDQPTTLKNRKRHSQPASATAWKIRHLTNDLHHTLSWNGNANEPQGAAQLKSRSTPSTPLKASLNLPPTVYAAESP